MDNKQTPSEEGGYECRPQIGANGNSTPYQGSQGRGQCSSQDEINHQIIYGSTGLRVYFGIVYGFTGLRVHGLTGYFGIVNEFTGLGVCGIQVYFGNV